MVRKTVLRTIDVLSHILYTGSNQQQRPDLCRMFDPKKLVVCLSEHIKRMVRIIGDEQHNVDSDDEDWGSSDDEDGFATVVVRKPAPTETDIVRGYLEKSINILLTFSVYVTMLAVDQVAIKSM